MVSTPGVWDPAPNRTDVFRADALYFLAILPGDNKIRESISFGARKDLVCQKYVLNNPSPCLRINEVLERATYFPANLIVLRAHVNSSIRFPASQINTNEPVGIG